MKPQVLVFICLTAMALGQPGFLSAPLTLTTLHQGVQVGADGRVLDTPEVAIAKAEHAAAHINERVRLANEAVRTVQVQTVIGQPTLLGRVLTGTVLVPRAPVGPDGRVVDTPEVAVAKAEHAAAQVNERINLANEAAKSSGAVISLPGQGILPVVTSSALGGGAPVGSDGRVVDTPEVTVAKAAHAAAQVNERINLANEAVRSGSVVATAGQTVVPLVAGNRLVTSVISGAPIGNDGRVQDTPEVAVAKAAHAAAHFNEKINLANEAVKSANVLAVAGPALAYGRLVY